MKRPIHIYLQNTQRADGPYRTILGGKKRTYFDDGSVEITEFDTLYVEYPVNDRRKCPIWLYTLAVLALLAWLSTWIPAV